MTLHTIPLNSIRDCTRVLPPADGQNVKVTINAFGIAPKTAAKHEAAIGRAMAQAVGLTGKSPCRRKGSNGAIIPQCQSKRDAKVRRGKILILIQERPRRVKELKEIFGESNSVINRDLEGLEDDRLIRSESVPRLSGNGRENLWHITTEEQENGY